jgi:hypothetical protein
MLYTSPWSGLELTASAVIATDCIGSCKSIYQAITATVVPFHKCEIITKDISISMDYIILSDCCIIHLITEYYPNDDVGGLDDVITVLMGDLQRMDHYVKLGFQTYQHIPEYVWSAYNILLSSGLYNNHF